MQVTSFLRLWSSFNSTWYLNENEGYKAVNTVNIDNTAPFVSITWHQMEPLDCVVYSHCPTNDSYNKCMLSCYLPYNHVIKPFGILQRVVKSQKVLMSSYIWKQQKKISFLSETFVAKFSDLFLNFQVSWKGNYLKIFQAIPIRCFFFKWNDFSSLAIHANVLILETAYGNFFLILYQMVLFPNIKQNRTSKIDPDM